MLQLEFPHSLQNYGFHPRFSISIPAISVNLPVEMHARTLQDVHHDPSLELRVVGKQCKDQVDLHRLATPTFAVGDMVWLLRRHISTTHPNMKLYYKKLSPFPIIKQINQVAFRLTLPQHLGFHNIFHVSLLELYHPSRIPGRQPPPLPPVELSTGEEYVVDQILDSRYCRRQLQYLVLWKGYPISDAT